MGVSAIAARLPPPVSLRLRAYFGGSRDPEIALLGRIVRPGSTAVDVGAHKGVYTYHLARLVGPAGVVHAFEPQPSLQRYLRSGLRTPRVKLHEFALGNFEGTAVLSAPVWGDRVMLGHASLAPATQQESLTVGVRVATLDSLELSPVLIKIDVEGFEAAVVAGSRKTMERCRPTLLVEIDYRHPSGTRDRLLRLLGDMKYDAYYLKSDVLVPVDLVAESDPNERLDAGRYVFNWFFIPSDRRAELGILFAS